MNADTIEKNQHSIANFDPSEYEIIAYLDNQRPKYAGQPTQAWAEECKFWEKEIESYYLQALAFLEGFKVGTHRPLFAI